MEARLKHLQQRVSNLRTESEEIWKTLETAEINLLDILNTKDYDCSGYFGDGTSVQAAKPEGLTVKSRADKQEIEEFYITVSTHTVTIHIGLLSLLSFFAFDICHLSLFFIRHFFHSITFVTCHFCHLPRGSQSTSITLSKY